MKKELPVLRVEADDIGWQHIDGKIWCELENVFAGLVLWVVPCYGGSTHIFTKVPELECVAPGHGMGSECSM